MEPLKEQEINENLSSQDPSKLRVFKPEIFKRFFSLTWFPNNKNRNSFEDLIFPALLFFSGASTVLWEETLLEKDPSNKLRLIALIYGLQIFSFLLLRPILRSILKVERSLLTQLSIIIIHLFPRYSLCLFNAK